MSKVILHHKGCSDGFGAAWLANRTFFPADTIEGVLYNEEPPWELIKGNDVLLVDFCFQTEELNKAAELSKSFLVLDHHETASHLLENSNLQKLNDFDEAISSAQIKNRSGAAYFHTNDRSGIGIVGEIAYALGYDVPDFVWHIEDRDLWKFQLDNTKEVVADIATYPFTIEAWDSIAATPLEEIINYGVGIVKYQNQTIERITSSWFWLELDGIQIPCCNSPYVLGSDCAEVLAIKHSDINVGAYAIVHGDHIQIGLRSRGEFNVNELAEKFNGGGHKKAAGLKLLHQDFTNRIGQAK